MTPTLTEESPLYYVAPPDNLSACPPWATVCMTLQQYALNASAYFTSDSIFFFLEGNHYINTPIHVLGLSEGSGLLQLITYSEAVVNCAGDVSLAFTNFSNISVDGLVFVGCGTTSEPALAFYSVMSVELLDLALVDSSRSDVVGHNVGNITINNCRFSPLPGTTSQTHSLQLVFDEGGRYSTHVSLTNSIFYTSQGSGAIYLNYQHPQHGSRVRLDNITIQGPQVAELVLGVANNATLLVEMNSTENSAVTHSLELTNSQVLNSLLRAMLFTLYSNANILIQNCTIAGSLGGGIAINIGYHNLSSLAITIDNSTLRGNSLYGSGAAGSALVVQPDRHLRFIQSPLAVRDSVFEGNVHLDSLGPLQSTLYLSDLTNVSFSNCTFRSNRGTGVLVARGTLTISGSIVFFNNTGYQGGGCALYGDSQLSILENNTLLNFTSNQANNVGGGLFILEDFVPFTQPLPNPCFFKTGNDVINTSFLFVRNSAMNGGNAIYGESVEMCSSIERAITGEGKLRRDAVFYFEPNASRDISVISSEPSRVCVCDEDGLPDCNVLYLSLSVIPGQVVSLPLVTVGHGLGAVTGSVFAEFPIQQANHTYHIRGGIGSQATSAQECRNISYVISSSADTALLALTAGNITLPYFDQQLLMLATDNSTRSQSVFLSYPVFVNISFTDCPLGTLYCEKTHGCVCDQVLTNREVECNILEGRVTLPGDLWVNVSYNSSGEPVGIIAQHCQLQYCISEPNNISLETPDEQCAHNRSGTLCGGCRAGLSLTLGSPTCRRCSNNYLLLLLAFAVNGILLVLFIKLLNLTVAVGTINGLIFYANIVWGNRSLFFDTGKTSFPLVFIAWLNLDLGVSTCFYDGLDMYALTWLQYAFPVYIWLLTLSIIVAAHYSLRVAKVFGTNSVPMLATLFLLTYNKILRTIIISLNVTQLQLPGGSSRLVWTYDSNYEYLGTPHVYLFTVAILLLVFAWLPYTGILFFGQWILRLPHNRFGGYLKPFLDAYYGPLRSGYCYWVGLLLLLRCALMLVFALDPQNTGALDLLVILLVALLLIFLRTHWNSVYRNCRVGNLETSFILNLAVLSSVQMYKLIAGKGRLEAIQTSVSIVFIKFLLILLYHTYTQLRNFKTVKRFEARVKKYLPNRMTNTSAGVVGTIHLNDSLQIESMHSPERSSNGNVAGETTTSRATAGIRRFLPTRTRSTRQSRGHRVQHTGHSNVGFSVVMGDSMETHMSQVGNSNNKPLSLITQQHCRYHCLLNFVIYFSSCVSPY